MTAPLVSFNATAYDTLPSGARNRTVGLAAALLRAGVRVAVLAGRSVAMRPLIETELGTAAGDALSEVATPLDSSGRVRRYFGSGSVLPELVPRDTSLFVTDYYPALAGVRTAVTIHDMRYFDARQYENRFRAMGYGAAFRSHASDADAVLVPTETMRASVLRWLAPASDRVHVVPNGLGGVWRDAPRKPLAVSHLLYVGTGESRKRVRLLVDAYAQASAAADLVPLVLAGRSTAFDECTRGHGPLVERGAIVVVASPSDAELVGLVRRAAALLHPSAYEGFGMPVIEALACGVPVVAADIPAVREVVGEVVEYVDPADDEGWVLAALRHGAGGRIAPPEGGVERARSYTWDRAAHALAALILP